MPTAAEPFGTIRDRALYLPDAEALVAADLHLGRIATSAVNAPLDDGSAMVTRLLDLVDRFDPMQVVLAGDVLDAFDTVPRGARSALGSLRAGVERRAADLVLLEGNHDTQLDALDVGCSEPDCHLADGTVVCHGHELPTSSGRRYVVGHDHPTIAIEGRRRPCFLYGRGAHDGGDVLGLPAFNPAVPGTTVNGWRDDEPLSPLLSRVSDLRPVVWDPAAEDALVFPPLGELRSYL